LPFNHLNFWFLFAPLIVIYWLIPHRGKNFFLLITSYLFYSFFDWRYCLIILFSTIVDYQVGKHAYSFAKDWRAKALLSISLACNLGLLIGFKYFYQNLSDQALHSLADGSESFSFFLALSFPIGISFYTFQTLSYTIDCYRRQIKPCRSLIDFALYVAFFPQLLAGPIERAGHLLPQLQSTKKIQWSQIQSGLLIILLGLVKKNFYAEYMWDQLQSLSNLGLDSGPSLLGLAFLMTFYVYFDFSGYCDMGRGLAQLFGINISLNFRPFYYAKTPTELWSRWNFTLTFWMRDYFVIPLTRYLKSKKMTPMIILLAMLIIGLWHGFSFGWAIFGLFQGVMIVFYRGIKSSVASTSIQYFGILGHGITLTSVFTMGLIHIMIIKKLHWSLLSQWHQGWTHASLWMQWLPLTLLVLIPIFIYEYFQENKKNYDFICSSSPIFQFFYVSVALFMVYLGLSYKETQFVYFNF
jgi:alginate O-acetyltransferase complex protein AlgI